MTDLSVLIATFTPEQKVAALLVLDALTRPLKPREVEVLLRRGGISQARAAKVAAAMKGLAVVAVVSGD